MASGRYQYEGAEYLKLGEETLPNYNNSIASMVLRYSGGAKDVMDFGAGIGGLTIRVRSLGVDPLCLEPDDRLRLELEQRRFRTVGSLGEVESESLDYIYSSNVLEHIEDDAQALAALRDRLRPGGRLFLYVPAFQSLYSSLDVMAGHVRRYDRSLLGSRLREAGFEVEELFYADFFGYFATRAFKRLGNSMSNANPITLRIFDRCIFPVGCMIERVVKVPVGKNIVGVARKA
jgi:SAM-dependent methyltransferase